MSIFRFKVGTRDHSFSSETHKVNVVFNTLHSVSSVPASNIAQLIHIPKEADRTVVKVALDCDPVIDVSNVVISFVYDIVYDIVPPTFHPLRKTLTRTYDYRLSGSIKPTRVFLPAILKEWERNSSTAFGLNGTNSRVTELSVQSRIKAVETTGEVRYSIFEFNTKNMQPGYYWLVLPVNLSFRDIPLSELDRIARRAKENIEREAAQIISNMRLSPGSSVYDYRVVFYDTPEQAYYITNRIKNAIIQQGAKPPILYSYFDGFNPYGIGPASYSMGGMNFYLADRVNKGAYTRAIAPAFAFQSGGVWYFPRDERYLMYKIENGVTQDPDFDVYVRFSLSGDLSSSAVWSPWEKFHDETGWQETFIKNLSLIDAGMGGNEKSEMKTVYVQFKRRVLVNNSIRDEYCVYNNSIYYTGEVPIVTAVRVAYVSEVD